MKQFRTIFRFECKGILLNKAFRWTTVLFVLTMALIMFLPKILGTFSDRNEPATERSEQPVMLIKSSDAPLSLWEEEQLLGTFEASFPDYKIVRAEKGMTDIEERIRSEKAECAFVMNDNVYFTYFVNNLGLYDANPERASEALNHMYRLNAMVENGMPIAQAGEIMQTSVRVDTQTLGTDRQSYFFYTYFMIIALYMVIVLYGQMVATNVAVEKSSRAMEMLITAAKPVSMMFAKILACCLAGFLQLLAIFGSALLFFNLTRKDWEENEIMRSMFDIPPSLFGFMLLFFVLGFLLYAFLYGAMGSTVSKVEDVNMAIMPVTLVFMLAFMIMVVTFTSGSFDSILMKVCSYIPFTSPMAMFGRIAMNSASGVEVGISVLILVVSVIVTGFLSAKIYRIGVLLYGNRPKLSSLAKALKKAS